MAQIVFILLVVLVAGNWAAPSNNELEELYVDTCQASCSSAKNDEEEAGCREKFCPNYVNYLLTGTSIPDAPPSFVSTQNKEVADFCATWMLYLIQELGWRRRIHLNLKDCVCAGAKDCITK